LVWKSYVGRAGFVGTCLGKATGLQLSSRSTRVLPSRPRRLRREGLPREERPRGATQSARNGNAAHSAAWDRRGRALDELMPPMLTREPLG
jgi:hypothetical protein